MKDQLYLLRPGFFKGTSGPCYCPDSASVEGMLGFFPALRELVDIHYLEFPKPRDPLIKALGNGRQSLPVLIVAADRAAKCPGVAARNANSRYYIDDQREIRLYLSWQYNLPQASE